MEAILIFRDERRREFFGDEDGARLDDSPILSAVAAAQRMMAARSSSRLECGARFIAIGRAFHIVESRRFIIMLSA